MCFFGGPKTCLCLTVTTSPAVSDFNLKITIERSKWTTKKSDEAKFPLILEVPASRFVF